MSGRPGHSPQQQACQDVGFPTSPAILQLGQVVEVAGWMPLLEALLKVVADFLILRFEDPKTAASLLPTASFTHS